MKMIILIMMKLKSRIIKTSEKKMIESKALMPWRPTSLKTAIMDIDEYDEILMRSKKKDPDAEEDDEDQIKKVEFWDRDDGDIL